MVARILIFAAVLLFPACQHCPPIQPTPVIRRTLPPRPALPAADLPEDSEPSEVVRALIGTIEALKGYALELEALIE